VALQELQDRVLQNPELEADNHTILENVFVPDSLTTASCQWPQWPQWLLKSHCKGILVFLQLLEIGVVPDSLTEASL